VTGWGDDLKSEPKAFAAYAGVMSVSGMRSKIKRRPVSTDRLKIGSLFRGRNRGSPTKSGAFPKARVTGRPTKSKHR
jgi:hypothetical protein